MAPNMQKHENHQGDPAFQCSSDTGHGTSVESAAQIADAAARSGSLAPGETLHLYRLVPVAPADDPRWDNSPNHGEVVVAARTSGDARLVAAGRELDFMEVDAAPGDDVTTINASAFRDEKLYTVIEIARDVSGHERGVVLSQSTGIFCR